MKQDGYDLEQAIKKFYKEEPLQQDLAARVMSRAFKKEKKGVPALDKWLYAFSIVLLASGIIYGIILFKQLPVSSLLIVVVPIIGFLGLSVKEQILLSKRLQGLS